MAKIFVCISPQTSSCTRMRW